MNERAKAILDFWFIQSGMEDWFKKDSQFDAKIQKLFLILRQALKDLVLRRNIVKKLFITNLKITQILVLKKLTNLYL